MTGFNRRVYEMLVRVQVFASTYPQYFAKGSQAAQLIGEIEAAVGKLSADALSQRSGQGAVKASSTDRAQARAILRNQLLAISHTARALRLGQFWMPRDTSDRTYVEFGQLFAAQAEPLKQHFIEGHLPPDFIEKLNAAVQNLEKTIKDQTFSKGTRIAAATSIAKTCADAFAAAQRLDPMMENVLRGDPAIRSVWSSARRLARRAAAAESPAPATPVTDSGATAAQA